MVRRDLVFDSIAELCNGKPDIVSLTETKLTKYIK